MFQSFVNLSKLVESLEDETAVFQDLDKCARDISSSKDLGCWWEEKIEVGVMFGGPGKYCRLRVCVSGVLVGMDRMGVTQEEFQSQEPQALVIHEEDEGWVFINNPISIH